jgi:hypothetical protein
LIEDVLAAFKSGAPPSKCSPASAKFLPITPTGDGSMPISAALYWIASKGLTIDLGGLDGRDRYRKAAEDFSKKANSKKFEVVGLDRDGKIAILPSHIFVAALKWLFTNDDDRDIWASVWASDARIEVVLCDDDQHSNDEFWDGGDSFARVTTLTVLKESVRREWSFNCGAFEDTPIGNAAADLRSGFYLHDRARRDRLREIRKEAIKAFRNDQQRARQWIQLDEVANQCRLTSSPTASTEEREQYYRHALVSLLESALAGEFLADGRSQLLRVHQDYRIRRQWLNDPSAAPSEAFVTQAYLQSCLDNEDPKIREKVARDIIANCWVPMALAVTWLSSRQLPIAVPAAWLSPMTTTAEAEGGQLTSSGKAKTGCRKWLLDEMRASPHHRPMAKCKYFHDAKKRFSGLSERSFQDAWAWAIEQSKSNWDKPGRPPKNPRT